MLRQGDDLLFAGILETPAGCFGERLVLPPAKHKHVSQVEIQRASDDVGQLIESGISQHWCNQLQRMSDPFHGGFDPHRVTERVVELGVAEQHLPHADRTFGRVRHWWFTSSTY